MANWAEATPEQIIEDIRAAKKRIEDASLEPRSTTLSLTVTHHYEDALDRKFVVQQYIFTDNLSWIIRGEV